MNEPKIGRFMHKPRPQTMAKKIKWARFTQHTNPNQNIVLWFTMMYEKITVGSTGSPETNLLTFQSLTANITFCS